MKQIILFVLVFTCLLAGGTKITLDEKTRNFDQLHIGLHLKIDFDKQEVHSIEQFKFVPLVNSFQILLLHSETTEISTITLNTKQLTFQSDSGIVSINLDKAYSPKDTVEIEITYLSRPEDGLFFFKPLPGIPAIPYQVWSQGEGTANRYWFPCYDMPDDKVATDLYVEVPKNMISVSNGELISVKPLANNATEHHWRIVEPQATYLTTLILGEFETVREKVNGVTLEYNVPKEWASKTEYFFGKTPSILRFFSDYILPYPFARYAQTTVQDFVYGGMENTTATTMNRRLLYDKNAMPNYTGHDLVAHEFAHQWWGDIVTCRNWNHAWLNEGFATYFTSMWDESNYGIDEYDMELQSMMDLYSSNLSTKNYNDSVLSAEHAAPALQDDKSYYGGAVILHMLRYELGDKMFREGIRHYIRKYMYQSVVTDDFRVAMEETAGRSLKSFFESWIYQAKVPEFVVTQSYDEGTKSLTLKVVQPDTAFQSFIYNGKLPLRVEFGGESLDTTIQITGKQNSYSFTVNTKPQAVFFNYKERILCRLQFEKSFDELAYILRYSESAVERMKALTAIKKFGEKITPVLTAAIQNEDFWRIRLAIVQACEAVPSAATFAIVTEAAGDDYDARVREEAYQVLKVMKDFGAIEFLRDHIGLEKNDYCRATLYASYGKLKAPDAFEVLSGAMQLDSHRNIIRRAVFEALGETSDDRGLPFANQMVEYNFGSGDLHHIELAALDYAEKFIEKDHDSVNEIIKKGLKNPYFRTRNSAARLIGKYKLREDADLLKSILASERRTDVKPELEKVLKSLQ